MGSAGWHCIAIWDGRGCEHVDCSIWDFRDWRRWGWRGFIKVCGERTFYSVVDGALPFV
jgi:hypothetical protein